MSKENKILILNQIQKKNKNQNKKNKYKTKIQLIQEKNLNNNLKAIYKILKKNEEIIPIIENGTFQKDKNWQNIYKKV